MLEEEKVEALAEVLEQPETVVTEGVENVTETEVKADEVTPITDADRAKYNIPVKFNDWGAVAKWGSEAEKLATKAGQEKGDYERRTSQLEESITEMKNAITEKKGATGSLTQEQKDTINAQFTDDMATDATGTMQKLFDAWTKKTDDKQAEKAAKEAYNIKVEKWGKDYAAIEKDPLYKDTWESEMKPALTKIAIENPGITRMDVILAIYEGRKAKEERFNKLDEEAKRTAKKVALTESGSGTGGLAEDILSKINADGITLAELEKLGASGKVK